VLHTLIEALAWAQNDEHTEYMRATFAELGRQAGSWRTVLPFLELALNREQSCHHEVQG
jgi:hypothetical protein